MYIAGEMDLIGSFVVEMDLATGNFAVEKDPVTDKSVGPAEHRTVELVNPVSKGTLGMKLLVPALLIWSIRTGEQGSDWSNSED